jgi:hypothetical protein
VHTNTGGWCAPDDLLAPQLRRLSTSQVGGAIEAHEGVHWSGSPSKVGCVAASCTSGLPCTCCEEYRSSVCINGGIRTFTIAGCIEGLAPWLRSCTGLSSVLSRAVSMTMDIGFYLGALDRVLEMATPDILP